MARLDRDRSDPSRPHVDQVEDESGEEDGGEEAGEDADREGDGEPLHRPRAELVEDGGGDEHGDVGVDHGAEHLPHCLAVGASCCWGSDISVIFKMKIIPSNILVNIKR